MHDSLIGCMFTSAVVFIFWLGYIISQDNVAADCQRLGSFYTRDTIYECKVKT